MNNLHEADMDRLMDLLVVRATHGLSEPEAAELETLLRQYPNVDEDQFDYAAAALASAFVSADEATTLPASLRQRIEQQFPAASTSQSTLRIAGRGESTDHLVDTRSTRRPSVFGNLGWLAAAACLGLAIFAWLPKLRGTAKVDGNTVVRFAQANADAFTISWTDFNALDTKEPPEVRNVKGQVVWSDTAQSGYMRFDNLPKNDPTKESYQLWIIDAERGLSQRVSGAVFDATGDAETIVPIQPQLPISKAAVFAVTIERPGGVVVSDMHRRVSLAAR